MAKVLKKEYREQVRLAKLLVKGIEVVIEEGEYQDLEETLRACQALKVVAGHIEILAKAMQDDREYGFGTFPAH